MGPVRGALGATLVPQHLKAAAWVISFPPTPGMRPHGHSKVLPRCHFCNSNKKNLNKQQEAAEREPHTVSWPQWGHSVWSPAALCLRREAA